MVTADEYTDRRVYKPVRPVRVSLRCKVEGCAGLMEATGESFTQWDTTHQHRCSMCGITEGIVNQGFPRIDYVPL